MNNKVIYTSMFGYADNSDFFLHTPKCRLDGWDLVCFTDNPNIKSDVWEVRLVTRYYVDGARDNRLYKILPHRHFKEYDISVCVDADVLITNNIDDVVNEHLSEQNLSVLDHSICGMTKTGNLNRRSCIYQEADFIKWLGDNHPRKKYKDDMNIIFNQTKKYLADGYPKNNGLARTTVIFRRHNEADVIEAMEKWWVEYRYNSRRDQLSFPYSVWKTDLKFKYMSIDIDDNKWFQLMKQWRKDRSKKVNMKYEPISLEYFLNMEFAGGTGGKEIITQNQSLKTVRDVYMFYSIPGNVQTVKDKLIPDNWQYFNCILAEFRKDVGDHHKLGWDKMTEEYYSNLELMNDNELETFLKENPVEFDNGFIKHSYHRACAMIGRLIKGKKYIPFYMKRSQIYDEVRKSDNLQRVKPLIHNVKGTSDISIPAGEFTICQSGILALMGIRQNDDIDIIISTEARNQIFGGDTNFIRSNGVEIFEPNRGKFRIFDAQGDDDLIENYSFNIGGYNFLEPRFYFSRKNKHTDRDKSDWDGIRKFFEMKSHKGYPFNKLTEEQWGVKFV